MNMRILVAVILLFIVKVNIEAQTNFGFSVGTSDSDDYTASSWYQKSVSDKLSIGFQFRKGGIKYRFINARAVESGSVQHIGLVLGFKLKETDKFRFDFNLSGAYRRVNSDEVKTESDGTNGYEIDGNIMLGFKVSDNVFFHAGTLLRFVAQTNEEAVIEQLPSPILTNALSYRFKMNLISLKTYIGPANGAGGDTLKFYRQVSLAFQMSIGSSGSNIIPFLNF